MNQELENEKEWRRFLMSEIAEIKKSQQETLVTITTLKLKIGAISMVFGGISSIIYQYLSGHK